MYMCFYNAAVQHFRNWIFRDFQGKSSDILAIKERQTESVAITWLGANVSDVPHERIKMLSFVGKV